MHARALRAFSHAALAFFIVAAGCDARPAHADNEPTCGKPGLKDCPLQSWMKSNLVKNKADGDFDAVAKALVRVPSFAPNGSGWADDWKSIAKKGADAASKADRDALDAACNECHTKYRKAYREKYRDAPIPY